MQDLIFAFGHPLLLALLVWTVSTSDSCEVFLVRAVGLQKAPSVYLLGCSHMCRWHSVVLCLAAHDQSPVGCLSYSGVPSPPCGGAAALPFAIDMGGVLIH